MMSRRFQGPGPALRFLFPASPTLTRSPGPEASRASCRELAHTGLSPRALVAGLPRGVPDHHWRASLRGVLPSSAVRRQTLMWVERTLFWSCPAARSDHGLAGRVVHLTCEPVRNLAQRQDGVGRLLKHQALAAMGKPEWECERPATAFLYKTARGSEAGGACRKVFLATRRGR
jgi:hypothetical protein